jgi:hypothetical protein
MNVAMKSVPKHEGILSGESSPNKPYCHQLHARVAPGVLSFDPRKAELESEKIQDTDAIALSDVVCI